MLGSSQSKSSLLIVVAVCTILAVVGTVHAQEDADGTDDTAVLRQLQDVTAQFDRAQEAAVRISDQGTIPVQGYSQSVFSAGNPALWILVGLLSGLLMLLLAIHRSIAKAGLIQHDQMQVAADPEPNPSAVRVVRRHSQPLVQPVKVVKIKVRKLKKKV